MTYPADFHQFFGREEGEDPQGNALWQLCDKVYVLFQLKRNEINSDTWRKMNTVFRILKKKKRKKEDTSISKTGKNKRRHQEDSSGQSYTKYTTQNVCKL